jgi:hypothetical protein
MQVIRQIVLEHRMGSKPSVIDKFYHHMVRIIFGSPINDKKI